MGLKLTRNLGYKYVTLEVYTYYCCFRINKSVFQPHPIFITTLRTVRGALLAISAQVSGNSPVVHD